LIQVIIAKVQTTPNDPLEVPVGPIIKLRAKKLKDTSNRLIHSIWVKVNFKEVTVSTSDDQTLVDLIYMQEGLNPSTTWA
jgi:hypothetical protein